MPDNKCLIAFSMLVIITASACSANMEARKQFEESIDQYKQLVSAQDFDTAGLFASEKVAAEFKSRAKAAKNIKVVDYRILGLRYDEEDGKAELKVEIEYYSLSSYKVKTLLDLQKWVYATENGVKKWRLVSLLPEFL